MTVHKRRSSSLTSFAAVLAATVAINTNRSSAVNNLRANRKEHGGLLNNSIVASAGDSMGPVFRLMDEDKEFYKDFLLELDSMDPTAAPATAPPTISPTASPTGSPTGSPTTTASESPTTPSPTRNPTSAPSEQPTRADTSSPTQGPSETPSVARSEEPSGIPTVMATNEPSASPSVVISNEPSTSPTSFPTGAPTTAFPSVSPTVAPVVLPTPSPVAPPTPSPVAPLVVTPSPSNASTEKCNLSKEARSALINIFLRVVSNPADVDAPGSPQMLALDWMIEQDPMQLCPQDKYLIQRYVMAVFYFSTRGDRWTQCSAPPPPVEGVVNPAIAEVNANALCSIQVAGYESSSNAWLTSESECSWGGLGCNEDKFVVRIEMEQNGVAGTLPYELSRLQNLRNLVLEEGILTGTIPTQLGELQSLEQIDLNFNLIGGPIPEELYSLKNLRQMDLNDNELTGTISTAIGQLLQMSFFQIENNLISGTVPLEIGALNQLEVATMDNNVLSGTMPCDFMNATGKMQVLTSDCLGAPNRPSPPLVICECCTQCF